MNALKTILAVSAVFTPLAAAADCWVVTDLRGYSARAAHGYALSSDAFSGQSFEVAINGASASVSSSNMKCHSTSERSLVCIDVRPGQSTIETWAIDPAAGKAFHTKAISGFGEFDGGNLFVGKVARRCKAAGK